MLNEIKKIVRETPDDIIMAAKVRKLVVDHDAKLSKLNQNLENALNDFEKMDMDELNKIFKK